MFPEGESQRLERFQVEIDEPLLMLGTKEASFREGEIDEPLVPFLREVSFREVERDELSLVMLLTEEV